MEVKEISGQPVIIGSGIAGLTVALEAAKHRRVTVISRGALADQTSSQWAQGGIAAAFGIDDNADLHYQDTMKAGAGLCDEAIVRMVTEGATDSVLWLRDHGVAFDTNADGTFKLGLEGGHSRRRIVHAQGDGTGMAIMRALVARVPTMPNITVLENAVVIDLVCEQPRHSDFDFESRAVIHGVMLRQDGKIKAIPTNEVVIATGGAGALWQQTTNPLGSWGQGWVLAARAGAKIRDIEFMQFHPTAIDGGRYPMPLASEALRGEGATLIDEGGNRFMAGQGKAELEPRDIVARAIWAQLQMGHPVFLDVRMIPDFASRFPTIHQSCTAMGIDPSTQPIPIRPAAHYHMGGIAVDDCGRCTLHTLYACGEAAATGLHGANRLASNSLLEGVFFGRRIAKALAASGKQDTDLAAIQWPQTMHQPESPETIAAIRRIMSMHVGVLRDQAGLGQAIAQLTPLADISDMALAGLMIAMAAMQRTESRGAHTRMDFPQASDDWLRQHILTIGQVLGAGNRLDKSVHVNKNIVLTG